MEDQGKAAPLKELKEVPNNGTINLPPDALGIEVEGIKAPAIGTPMGNVNVDRK